MDFIVAASNLRAENYDIPPADRHKVGLFWSVEWGIINPEWDGAFTLKVQFMCFVFSEQTDCREDHTCHCHNDSGCSRLGVSGTIQSDTGSQETWVLQERLHELGVAFLWFLWSHCLPKEQGECGRVPSPHSFHSYLSQGKRWTIKAHTLGRKSFQLCLGTGNTWTLLLNQQCRYCWRLIKTIPFLWRNTLYTRRSTPWYGWMDEEGHG